MNLQDLMEKAHEAKTSQELLALAKEMNIEMSAQDAEETFALLNKKGELSDEELDNVSGGNNSIELPYHCSQCGGSNFGLCLKDVSENVATLCWFCTNCGKILEPGEAAAQS